MNVIEFAEQIVFGTTLEEKLMVPGKLSYSRSAKALQVDSLVAPCRPRGLEMRHGKSGSVQPPSDHLLENEKSRGQLLHFLANHELLATELMALTLLKFPDAPHAFRQGVLVTLQEEQEHTRMYLRRMQECGVEFGSFPLSGQFWRVVEPMQSPMDFVSRLSLTFEQANLDYSLHFASVFDRIGDQATASLLQKIYEDEIGHVQHGLHWFRQWKDPGQSDWEAYQASLEFPMSPQRGRGPRGQFNREGRRRAGLSDEFIDAIEVFRQSRGRAPTVRWFSPAAEAELAGEIPSALPREQGGSRPQTKSAATMNQLQSDLEYVMLALARQDDVVLVEHLPSRAIRKHWIDAGFELPEFVPLKRSSSASVAASDALAQRKLHDFAPWAWTPQSIAVAAPLAPAAHIGPPKWNDSLEALFRKSWSTARLKQWQTQGAAAGELQFTSSACVGEIVFTLDDVAAAVKTFAMRGYEAVLFKQDLAASGRGQRRLGGGNQSGNQSGAAAGELTESDMAWLRSIAAKTGVSSKRPLGVVEPELNRVLDLSFLWQFDTAFATTESGAKFLGWTRPLVSPGRRFAGTRLSSPFADCEPDVKRFLLADKAACLQRVQLWLERHLLPELKRRKFSGRFGVDALVCREPDGGLKIKPLVELNPRTTMGHVALEFARRIEPGVSASFEIFSRRDWEIFVDATTAADRRLKKSRSNRWSSGVLLLADVSPATKLVPAVVVGLPRKAI